MPTRWNLPDDPTRDVELRPAYPGLGLDFWDWLTFAFCLNSPEPKGRLLCGFVLSLGCSVSLACSFQIGPFTASQHFCKVALNTTVVDLWTSISHWVFLEKGLPLFHFHRCALPSIFLLCLSFLRSYVFGFSSSFPVVLSLSSRLLHLDCCCGAGGALPARSCPPMAVDFCLSCWGDAGRASHADVS